MTKRIFKQLTKVELMNKLKYLLQFTCDKTYDYDRLILDVIEGIYVKLNEEYSGLTVDKKEIKSDSNELIAALTQEFKLISHAKILALRSVQIRKTLPFNPMLSTVFIAVGDNLGSKKARNHVRQ